MPRQTLGSVLGGLPSVDLGQESTELPVTFGPSSYANWPSVDLSQGFQPLPLSTFGQSFGQFPTADLGQTDQPLTFQPLPVTFGKLSTVDLQPLEEVETPLPLKPFKAPHWSGFEGTPSEVVSITPDETFGPKPSAIASVTDDETFGPKSSPIASVTPDEAFGPSLKPSPIASVTPDTTFGPKPSSVTSVTPVTPTKPLMPVVTSSATFKVKPESIGPPVPGLPAPGRPADAVPGAPGPAVNRAAETTVLSPKDEAAFQNWVKQNKITDVDAPQSRYDYRGFWQATDGKPHPPGSVEHFPDTFKQHGHPTFSEESQYSKGPGDGGKWVGDQFVPAGAPLPPVKVGPPTSAVDALTDRMQLAAKMSGTGPLMSPSHENKVYVPKPLSAQEVKHARTNLDDITASLPLPANAPFAPTASHGKPIEAPREPNVAPAFAGTAAQKAAQIADARKIMAVSHVPTVQAGERTGEVTPLLKPPLFERTKDGVWQQVPEDRDLRLASVLEATKNDPQLDTVLGRFSQGTVGGFLSSLESGAALGRWAGVIPDEAFKEAQRLAQSAIPDALSQPIDWADPKFWAYSAGQTIASISALALAAEVPTTWAGAFAERLSLSKGSTALLREVLGPSGVAAASEALFEGGSAYSQAKKDGASDAQAADTAQLTIIENIPWIFLTDLSVFNPQTRSRIINAASATMSQGLQEVGQQAISQGAAQTAYNSQTPITEGMLQSGIVGGLTGALFGGIPHPPSHTEQTLAKLGTELSASVRRGEMPASLASALYTHVTGMALENEKAETGVPPAAPDKTAGMERRTWGVGEPPPAPAAAPEPPVVPTPAAPAGPPVDLEEAAYQKAVEAVRASDKAPNTLLLHGEVAPPRMGLPYLRRMEKEGIVTFDARTGDYKVAPYEKPPDPEIAKAEEAAYQKAVDAVRASDTPPNTLLLGGVIVPPNLGLPYLRRMETEGVITFSPRTGEYEVAPYEKPAPAAAAATEAPVKPTEAPGPLTEAETEAYQKSVAHVQTTGQASIDDLQRHLGGSFEQATKLMWRMAEAGIVTPTENDKWEVTPVAGKAAEGTPAAGTATEQPAGGTPAAEGPAAPGVSPPGAAGAGAVSETTPPETHEFSSTQVNLPEQVAASVRDLGTKLIPDEALTGDGRETTPHVTVKYGLKTDDVEAVREVLKDEPPITVTLGETSVFPNGESNNGDVVKIDVESPALHQLNAKIAEALPTEDTHPEYKPHVTLAYVTPGRGQEFAGNTALKGQQVTLNSITFTTRDGQVHEIPLTGTPTAAPVVDKAARRKAALDELEARQKARDDAAAAAAGKETPAEGTTTETPAEGKPVEEGKPAAEGTPAETPVHNFKVGDIVKVEDNPDSVGRVTAITPTGITVAWPSFKGGEWTQDLTGEMLEGIVPARSKVDLEHAATRVPNLVTAITKRKNENVGRVTGWYDELANHIRNLDQGGALTPELLQKALTVWDRARLIEKISTPSYTPSFAGQPDLVQPEKALGYSYINHQGNLVVKFFQKPPADVLAQVRRAGLSWRKDIMSWVGTDTTSRRQAAADFGAPLKPGSATPNAEIAQWGRFPGTMSPGAHAEMFQPGTLVRHANHGRGVVQERDAHDVRTGMVRVTFDGQPSITSVSPSSLEVAWDRNGRPINVNPVDLSVEQGLRAKVTPQAIVQKFGVSMEQAVAIDILLDSVGSDFKDKLLLTRGGVPGSDALHQYAGEASDIPGGLKRSLVTAQAMAAAGKSSEEIRLATGWFIGPYDGRLRYETDDSVVQFTPEWTTLQASETFGAPHTKPLSDLIVAPELFKLYPTLKDIQVMRRPGLFDFTGGLQGWYDTEKHQINITPNAKDPRTTLLHEIQHAIQKIEGFALGANTQQAVEQAPYWAIADSAEKIAEKLSDQRIRVAESLNRNDLGVFFKWSAGLTDEQRGEIDRLAGLAFDATDRKVKAFQARDRSGPYVNFYRTPEGKAVQKADLDAKARLRDAAPGLDRGLSLRLAQMGNIEETIDVLKHEQQKRVETIVALDEDIASVEIGLREEMEKVIKKHGGGMELYLRVAGEIESRDVESRKDLTEAQRIAAEPFSSSNVSPHEAIRIYDKAGVAPSVLYQSAPDNLPKLRRWYYSNISKALETWQPKGTPAQLLAHIAKFAGAQEEARWTGFNEWLTGRELVSRADAQRYLDEHQIEVHEVVRDDGTFEMLRNQLAIVEGELRQRGIVAVEDPGDESAEPMLVWEGSNVSVEESGTLTFDTEQAIARYRRLEGAVTSRRLDVENVEGAEEGIPTGEYRPTKYSDATEPGGKNYREILLTKPLSKTLGFKVEQLSEEGYPQQWSVEFGDEPRPGQGITGYVTDHTGDRHARSRGMMTDARPWKASFQNKTEWFDSSEAGIAWVKAQLGNIEENVATLSAGFRSSHWEERNVLAHIRLDDRIINGLRTLFIEEVQSDWGREGRKQGFVGEMKPSRRRRSPRFAEPLPIADTTAPRGWAVAESSVPGTVPRAPFVQSGDWVNLTMKRVMAYAAEHGYEQIAWTNSEQQKERNNLEQIVKEIRWSPVPEGTQLYATGARQGLTFNLQNGTHFVAQVDDEGIVISGKGVPRAVLDAHLDDVVGRDVAARILDDPDQEDALVGQELKIGGKWAVNLYDRTMPKLATAIGKKYGVSVEEHPLLTVPRPLDLHVGGVFGPRGAEGGPARLYTFFTTDNHLTGENQGTFATEAEAVAALPAFVAKREAAWQEAQQKDRVQTMLVPAEMRRDILERGLPLFQGNRASFEIMEGGIGLVRALDKPDVSSLLHEIWHGVEAFLVNPDLPADQRRGITDVDIAVYDKATGAVDGVRTRETRERGAKLFELYIKTGEAPNTQLQTVFGKFKAWLSEIYAKIQNYFDDVQLTPEVTAFFDRVVTRADRVAAEKEAPEREAATKVGEGGTVTTTTPIRTAPLTPEEEAKAARRKAAAERIRKLAQGLKDPDVLYQSAEAAPPINRETMNRMLEILDTLEADGFTDFNEVVPIFHEAFGQGARAFDKVLEDAWEILHGETVSVEKALQSGEANGPVGEGNQGLLGTPESEVRPGAGEEPRAGQGTEGGPGNGPVSGGGGVPGGPASVPGVGTGDGVDRPSPTQEVNGNPNPPAAGTPGPVRVAGADLVNYRITDADQIGVGTPAVKFRQNVAAIKLAKAIIAENRPATAKEQAVLVKFVGWGGLRSQLLAAEDDLVNDDVLTRDEFHRAFQSSANAHYTSPEVIRAIWQGITDLGFKTGRVLEPSMGVGHFFGLAPADLRPSQMAGVELDTLTGQIAQLLYPQSKVQVAGFQNANLPQGYFDLAVSNVPFGRGRVPDPLSKIPHYVRAAIHNYFFAKALQKVRPGGMIVFITTHGTLDAYGSKDVREFLGRSADFLGAVRMPDTTFKANAGTEVVTDLIFMRKRRAGEIDRSVSAWTESSYQYKSDQNPDGIPVSQYFQDHPELVIGTMAAEGTLYGGGGQELSVKYDGTDLHGDIAKAIRQVTQNIVGKGLGYQENQDVRIDTSSADVAPDAVIEQMFYLDDKKDLRQKLNGLGAKVEMDPKAKAIMLEYLKVRDAFRQTIAAMKNPESTKAEIEKAQKAMAKAYDAFVDKHGALHKAANAKILTQDPFGPATLAIETWDPDTKKADKAAIFRDRTVLADTPLTEATSPAHALLVSLSEKGGIDWQRISDLLKMTVPEAKDALVAENRVFETPEGPYVVAEHYLAGRVRDKLAAARAAAELDPRFARNVTALEAVQPADLGPERITVNLGAPWVPIDVVNEFMASLGGRGMRAQYRTATAEWAVTTGHASNFGWGRTEGNVRDWSTSRVDFRSMMDATLNNQQIVVRDRDGVTEAAPTLEAQVKQQAIRNEFRRWAFDDQARTPLLVRSYNDLHNAIVLGQYDGQHLDLPGMTAEWRAKLRPHQINAIWRAILEGNTYLAHTMGAGKTVVFMAIAMEYKRLGLAKKPIIVIPKKTLPDYARMAEVYPNARILIGTKRDTKGDARKQFMARIATGDWDAIIITRDFMTKMPAKLEAWQDYLQEQIDELREAAAEEDAERANQGRRRGRLSDLVRRIQALEDKMEENRLKIEARGDVGLHWEDLGVDMILADEAHGYRKMQLATQLNQLAGVPAGRSARGDDMYIKSRQIQQNTPGRNLVFGSGTPIVNSVAEMYVIQKYLQPEALRLAGVSKFDAWAATFGSIVTKAEADITGTKIKLKRRFSEFTNMNGLIQMFRSFMDVKMLEDLGLPTPPIEGGQAEIHVVDAGEMLKAYIQTLAGRVEALDPRDLKTDNMLKISGDGRKAALDLRMVGIEEGGHKMAEIADEVVRTYKKWDAKKGTQLIFMEQGVGDKEADFKLYADLKDRLVRGGIPEGQIAFLRDAKGDTGEELMMRRMRSGEIRVMIGTKEVMGTGVNVQDRLVALHHADPHWLPALIEQADGRGIRQGNKFFMQDSPERIEGFTLAIHHYITKGSFDAFMWQAVARKMKMLNQALRGNLSMDRIEEVGGGAILNPEEVAAIATGNPIMIERAQLEAEIMQLQIMSDAHDRNMRDRQRDIATLPARIEATKGTIARTGTFKTAIADPVATVDGKVLTLEEADKAFRDRFMTPKEEGGKAMADTLLEMVSQPGSRQAPQPNGWGGPDVTVPFGDINGFPVFLRTRFNKSLTAVVNNVVLNPGDNLEGFTSGSVHQIPITRLLEEINTTSDSRVKIAQENISQDEASLAEAQAKIDQPFKDARRIAEIQDRLHDIYQELGGSRDQQGTIDNTPDDDDVDEPDDDSGGDYLGLSDDDEAENGRGSTVSSDSINDEIGNQPNVPTEQQPIELPELFAWFQEMGGVTELVKAFRKVGKRGEFRTIGNGVIRLPYEMFLPGNENALAAVFAHEMGHWIDWLPDKWLKRGNLLGRLFTLSEFRKGTFTTPDGRDIKNKTIKAELVAASALWRPWDATTAPESFRKYRMSAKELYADALSMLLRNPGLLEQTAPTFFHEFFEALDEKPEVKLAYFEVQDLLSRSREEVVRRRLERDAEMFGRGTKRAIELQREEMARRDSLSAVQKFRTMFIDINTPIIDKVVAAEKAGAVIPEEQDPRYFLQENNYIGGKQKGWLEREILPIYEDLIKAGVTPVQFGQFLFNERIAFGDRDKLANPNAIQPAAAAEKIAQLEQDLGPEKTAAVRMLLGRFRAAGRTILDEMFQAGLLTDKQYESAAENPYYATWNVIDYMSTQVDWQWKTQKGTTKEVTNPFEPTVLKLLTSIRAIHRNQMVQSVVSHLQQFYRDEIRPAETRWDAETKSHMPIPPSGPEKKDWGLVTYRDHGKYVGVYVDIHIANAIANKTIAENQMIMSVLNVVTMAPFFRPLFTTFNAGFQLVFNPARDFQRFWKNMPRMSLAKAIKLYLQAVPAALHRAKGGETGSAAWDTITRLEEAKILGITYNTLVAGQEGDDVWLEHVFARSGLPGYGEPKRGKLTEKIQDSSVTGRKLLVPFLWLADQIRSVGDFFETMPKVAGAIHLAGGTGTKLSELSPMQRSFIRQMVGTPDILAHGSATAATNKLFLYSNAMIQGTRSDWRMLLHPGANSMPAVGDQPAKASGVLWKTAAVNLVPKMIMYGLLAGMGGDWLRKILERGSSEYDRTNYIVIPMGMDSQGNGIVWRLPQDQFGQFLGGVFWKGLQMAAGDKGVSTSLSQIFDYIGGNMPNVSPGITAEAAMWAMMSGRNVYDPFRGREVLTREEQARREGPGWPEWAIWKKFLGWELQQIGMGVIWSPSPSRPGQEKTTAQQILDLPGISNTLGRSLKISNYGRTEKMQKVAGAVRGQEAQQRFKENELIAEQVQAFKNLPAAQRAPGQATEDAVWATTQKLVRDLYPDPDDQAAHGPNIAKKMFVGTILDAQRPGAVSDVLDLVDVLDAAGSNAQKLAILKSSFDEMSEPEYRAFLNEAMRVHTITNMVRMKALDAVGLKDVRQP